MTPPPRRGARKARWATAWPILPDELAELERNRRKLVAHNDELRRLGQYERPRAYGREVARLMRSLMRRCGPERADKLAAFIIVRDEAEKAILHAAQHGPDDRAEG